MILKFGTSEKTGKAKGFDLSRLSKLGRNTNILTIGADVDSRTLGIIDKMNQIDKEDDGVALVITDRPPIYDEMLDNPLNCKIVNTMEFYNNAADVVNDIEEFIVASIDNLDETYIFIDKDFIAEGTNLYKYMLQLYEESTKRGYTLNTCFSSVALIPDEVLYNSNILELYTLKDKFETNITAYDALHNIVNVQDYNKAKALARNEKLLSIDKHTILLRV